LPTRTRRW